MKSDVHEGVIYVVFGYDYVIMTIKSALSLKRIHPNLPITLVTNIPIKEDQNISVDEYIGIDGPLFNEVVKIDAETVKNRNIKTNIRSYSPYEKTLFLDCDTVINRRITPGFDFLDYFDIALASSPTPIATMATHWEGDMHVENVNFEDTPQWNSGVFFFNKKGTENFFKLWHNSHKSFGYNKDQFALLHAIYNTDVTVMSLDMSWNSTDVSMHYAKSIKENMRVYHYSFPPVRELRKIEQSIGQHLIDLTDKELSEARQDFKENFSNFSHLKNKLKRNPKTRPIYTKARAGARLFYNKLPI